MKIFYFVSQYFKVFIIFQFMENWVDFSTECWFITAKDSELAER